MDSIRILIADSSYLLPRGLKTLIQENDDLELAGEVINSEQLAEALASTDTDIVFLDYSEAEFRIEDIQEVQLNHPNTRVLAITELTDKEVLRNAMRLGVGGHLLKCCDRQEILDALHAVRRGDKFYCGKILDAIKDESIEEGPSCTGFSLSDREIEIIGLIAEGLTNKEIAEKLFISAHTVMTHRKNVMAKLGINNTAGIVMYAIKEKLISPNRFLFSPTEN